MFGVLLRLPVCAVLYVWLYFAEGPTTHWSSRLEPIARWITGSPRFARRFFRRASKGSLLGKSQLLALGMYYRACALAGDVVEAEEGFSKGRSKAPESEACVWWQKIAIATFVQIRRPDIAARLEFARFQDMAGTGGWPILLSSARLYQRALMLAELDHVEIAGDAIDALRGVLDDVTIRDRLPGLTTSDLAQLEESLWQYLTRSGRWRAVVDRLGVVDDLAALPPYQRRLWRLATRGQAQSGDTKSAFSALSRYFKAMAASPSTTDVDRHDWLLSAAVAHRRAGLNLIAKVCAAQSRDLAISSRGMEESVWSQEERRATLASLAPLPERYTTDLEAIARRLSASADSKSLRDAADTLLLDPTASGGSLLDALLSAGEAMRATGRPAHHVLLDLEDAARQWAGENEVQELRRRLGREAKEAEYMDRTPNGLHPDDRKEYATILARVETAMEAGRARREDLERLSELSVEISPAEERLTHLVALAALAKRSGYGSIAESCLLGARRTCANYDDVLARCKIFYVLVSALREYNMQTHFPTLFESISREGFTTARNTAILASGYNDAERAELKELARRIEMCIYGTSLI